MFVRQPVLPPPLLGTITGWLDDLASEFVDTHGNPAALYHVKYHSGSLAGDEEDLEGKVAKCGGPKNQMFGPGMTANVRGCSCHPQYTSPITAHPSTIHNSCFTVDEVMESLPAAVAAAANASASIRRPPHPNVHPPSPHPQPHFHDRHREPQLQQRLLRHTPIQADGPHAHSCMEGAWGKTPHQAKLEPAGALTIIDGTYYIEELPNPTSLQCHAGGGLPMPIVNLKALFSDHWHPVWGEDVDDAGRHECGGEEKDECSGEVERSISFDHWLAGEGDLMRTHSHSIPSGEEEATTTGEEDEEVGFGKVADTCLHNQTGSEEAEWRSETRRSVRANTWQAPSVATTSSDDYCW